MDESSKIVAFTFDDSPNKTTTVELLDLFEQYNGKASFFLIGDNINSETEVIVKRAYDMGCDICNHTKTHSALSTLTAEEIRYEIDYTSNEIERITGEKPKFYRAPYGAMNELSTKTIDLVAIGGYFTKDWLDYVDSDTRAKYILSNIHDGCLMAMHDFEGNKNTVEALKIVLPILQAQGYRFVNLTELFNEKHVIPDEGLKPEERRCYTYAEQKETLHYNHDPVIVTLGDYSGKENAIFPGGPAYATAMSGVLTGTVAPVMMGNTDEESLKAINDFNNKFFGLNSTYLKIDPKEYSTDSIDENILAGAKALITYDDYADIGKIAAKCRAFSLKLFIIEKAHSEVLKEYTDEIDTVFAKGNINSTILPEKTVAVPEDIDLNMYAGVYTAFYMTFGERDYAAKKAVDWYKTIDRRCLS